jgi:cyclopropane fatty-acyl-phospholipid synthase-like methyltransferase
MNVEEYRKYMTAEMLMGPNSLRILEELLIKHPLTLSADCAVLDLGCGKGLTSLALARETSAKVYANDLWIPAEANAERFDNWGMGEQLIPVHEDANALSFAKETFDALVSIDSYHYFATQKGFFEGKILPFLRDKATVLIGVPGIKDEFAGRSEELLSDWLGDEAYMFQSPHTWKKIIGHHDRVDLLETWEMDCFDAAWREWFDTEHKYALDDKHFFETLIKPYTCFVGICIKLK